MKKSFRSATGLNRYDKRMTYVYHIIIETYEEQIDFFDCLRLARVFAKIYVLITRDGDLGSPSLDIHSCCVFRMLLLKNKPRNLKTNLTGTTITILYN